MSPRRPRWLAPGYLQAGLRAFAGRGPLFLTVFVTARCPLHCGHCFYQDERDQAPDELTLSEIQRLTQRLPPVPKLILTGGEPFVRQDLATIVEAFHDGRSRSRQITIPSAGVFPERVRALAERVLPDRPDLVLEIQLSLDGVHEKHDAIRGPGIFDRLMETWRILEPLQRRHPGLRPRLVFTFSRATQHQFDETLDFVERSMPTAPFDMVLVRKKSADDAFWGEVDTELYRHAAARLHAREARLRGKRAGPIMARRARLEREVIARHHVGDPVMTGCKAGTLIAVISETGELYPCEILDRSLGNLREVDFDFRSLWRGERATAFRAWLRGSGCACTFETSVRTTLTFRPLWSLGAWRRLT